MNGAYEKGLKNFQMLSHHIQKDLTKPCAKKVTAVIMDEIGDRNLCALIDESRDVSIKEQMGVILRFVNDEGKVMERFLDLQHIERCTAIALKEALFGCLVAKHHDVLLEKVENGEITTRSGLNQESSLARPGDTRWGSHFKTLFRILVMWEAIIDVLEIVRKDSTKPTFNGGAFGLMGKMQRFDFVFIMHLVIDMLSITDDLSRALQRKDQDIVEAMSLLKDVKELLQENGWEPLLNRGISFYNKHVIKVPKMDKEVNERGASTRRRHKVTNKHYYHVEIYLAAIDAILVEMNHRFSEVSSELLVCMSSLNPHNSFSNFDVDKLVKLAEIYVEAC
uniref:HAT dimerisation domain-containing protein, putative n=1 Tax=Oryza sativa subsp. japonica TaxID=39947 RepID=Q2QWL3_ORYSJ|nr:hAT dimerisation domain-containing protein, putative [Oryza sativa Japonica Group]